MSTPIIRAAVRTDSPTIAALLGELNRGEGNMRTIDARAIEQALFTPRAVELRAYVAEKAGQVVAAALYYSGYDTLTASEGYHLADIIVTQAHRRCGIARALLGTLAAQALREGGQWISLTVLRENAAARGFYQSLGMTEVAVDFFAMGPSALMKLSG